jgi:hypothetical protein
VSLLNLVHLVRKAEGVETLERFLASYRAHDAGIEHELILLFKGFEGHADVAGHLALAEGLGAHELHVSDEGFDLTAYHRAAQRLTAERCCFVNSHSRILAGGWLARLAAALDEPGVGIAGASGSWASLRSYALLHLGLPGPYGRIFEDRREAVATLAEVAGSERAGGLRGAAYTAISLAGDLRGFDGFPAPHVRTNAFVIERARFLRVASGALTRKVQAHRLESGRTSITRAVEREGAAAVVVDREGRSYRSHDWPASETFWQGSQRGLMVGDNQTGAYERAAPAQRRVLARYAWGAQGDG